MVDGVPSSAAERRDPLVRAMIDAAAVVQTAAATIRARRVAVQDVIDKAEAYADARFIVGPGAEMLARLAAAALDFLDFYDAEIARTKDALARLNADG